MTWQVVVAVVLIVPVILLPVLFVWYLNMGGIFAAAREARARRVARQKGVKVTAPTE